MHLVFELIASMNEEESDKTTIKTENRNRNEENRRQIIDFIADYFCFQNQKQQLYKYRFRDFFTKI